MGKARLFAYRFRASPFRSFGKHGHAMVAVSPVEPLGPPKRMGDLPVLHAAGIQLRVPPNLWEFVDAPAGRANYTRDVSRGTSTVAAG